MVMTDRGELTVQLQRVSQLLKGGDVRGAIASCRALLAAFPKDNDVLSLLGMGYLRQGNFSEAEQYLSLALQSAPHDPTLLNALGTVRMKQEAYDEAIRFFLRTLEIQPVNGDALSNLATVFTVQQQPSKATPYLDRLTEVQPYSAPAHKRASDNRLALSDVDQAIQFGRRAVRLAPEDAQGRLSLADALEAGGRFKQAKFQYLAVLEEHAGDASALSGLLSLKGTHVSERYLSSAEQLLKSNRLADGERVQLHLAVARHLDERGDYTPAFQHLERGNAIRFRNHHFDSAAYTRAVDRLMDTFSASTISSFPPHEVRSRKPLFIVGMPRSGTTLVEQILASHSEVAAGGELSTIINIAARVAQRGATYPEAMPGIDRGSLAQWAQHYLEKLALIHPHAARVTDKMPFNFMHLGLIVALFPAATIIHCRRDARDTCLSCYFTGFNEQLQFASDLKTLGRYWLDYRRLMQHWSTVLPVRILEVDYERLVTSTEQCVREMLEFADLAWDPACMHFHQTDRGIRTPSRWQVRQPIYRQSVGRWRNYERQLLPLLDVLAVPAA